MIWKTENKTWVSSDVIDKIKSMIESYRKSCDIDGNCLDPRLCHSCFLGGAVELGDEILDIIKEAENE